MEAAMEAEVGVGSPASRGVGRATRFSKAPQAPFQACEKMVMALERVYGLERAVLQATLVGARLAVVALDRVALGRVMGREISGSESEEKTKRREERKRDSVKEKLVSGRRRG
jgi:hypothetical protein